MSLRRSRAGLYLLCIARAGYRDGAWLIEFIEDWQRVVKEHGGPVTMEGYVELTHLLPRRTAYRRLALFRKAFPELGPDGVPSALMGPLLERLAGELPESDFRREAWA